MNFVGLELFYPFQDLIYEIVIQEINYIVNNCIDILSMAFNILKAHCQSSLFFLEYLIK